MATKLIRLHDDILVEVQATEDETQQISGGFAKKVESTFDEIKPFLLKVCQPIADAVKDVRDQVGLEQVEIELGLSFAAGGDIYVAKASLSANLLVRMTLKNKE